LSSNETRSVWDDICNLFSKIKVVLLKFVLNVMVLGLGTPFLFESELEKHIKILITIAAVILITALTEIIENKQRSNIQAELDPQYELTFSYISMSLETILLDVLNSDLQEDSKIEKLLVYIQASIISILKGNSIEVGEICVNLMIQTEDVLRLTHFDIARQDRKYVDIEINRRHPGAPKAYSRQKLQYVKDTQSNHIRKYFRDKPYRCILSYPLIIRSDATRNNEVYGVLNIDSNLVNQFKSIDFVQSKISSALNPLLSICQGNLEMS